MIVSEVVEVKKSLNTKEIECELINRGFTPLRWAIVGVNKDTFKISLSHIKS